MYKSKLLSLGLIAVLSSSLVLPAQTTTATTKTTDVHFINVGQGDGAYIKTANGDDIVIDAGNKDGSDVVTYLKKQKVKDIEVMIATHPDADHIGGLDEVLKAFKVKAVYAPKVSHTTQAYEDFLKAVKKEKLKIKTAKKGTELSLKGVKATFIAPVKSYSNSDLNNWSAVLKLVHGKKSFLFTGDAELKSETDMIASKQNLQSNVLKVGHHGAKTSSSAAFVKAIKPQYAVISVGKNAYGHPTKEVLNRLKPAKIYRTDQKGHIVFSTDGKKLTVKTEKK